MSLPGRVCVLVVVYLIAVLLGSISCADDGPPRCRMFHSAGLGQTTVPQYYTFLSWREHADYNSSTATWTLNMTIRATQEARVLFSGAERMLDGQPHYEVILRERSSFARGANNKTLGNAQADASGLFSAPAQLIFSWRVVNNEGVFSVLIQKAGQDATPLITFSDHKPVQIEYFSMATASETSASFNVCTCLHPHLEPGPGFPLMPSLPGCRSIFTHARHDVTHTSNLALNWSDSVDDEGRLLFWVRALADVHVLISGKVRPGPQDAVYEVTFGGNFNTQSWVVGAKPGGNAESRVPTPSLLSSTQFRPLWVKVSPQQRVTAGEGVTDKNAFIGWTNPTGVVPRYISLATYRYRMAQFLVDCPLPQTTTSTAPTSQAPPSALPAWGAVRSVISTPASGAVLTVGCATRDDEGLVQLEGSLEMVWVRGGAGVLWNPHDVGGISRLEFNWNATHESLSEVSGEKHAEPSLRSSRAGDTVRLQQQAPLAVSADGVVSWRRSLRVTSPCSNSSGAADQAAPNSVVCAVEMRLSPWPQGLHVVHANCTEPSSTDEVSADNETVVVFLQAVPPLRTNASGSSETHDTLVGVQRIRGSTWLTGIIQGVVTLSAIASLLSFLALIAVTQDGTAASPWGRHFLGLVQRLQASPLVRKVLILPPPPELKRPSRSNITGSTTSACDGDWEESYLPVEYVELRSNISKSQLEDAFLLLMRLLLIFSLLLIIMTVSLVIIKFSS